MPRNSLPPGFRFHPTDVELVLYYLKRKIMGKKLHYEAIDEVNIYKFSPWDLPDKSCLKSKDLEWFFFCPREKKYASGTRVKRATENGYWKTTGKDRNIYYNDRTVGAVKTLVFHLGHAPQGERTDWVIHEFKILDDKLAEEGIQDTYVLCKVFKKNGPGPKNGAQYGAPFNEADWVDDEVDVAENHGIPLASGGPSLATLAQTEKLIFPLEKGLFAPGSTSGLPVLEGPLPSAGSLTCAVDADVTDDEIQLLLAPFTVEDMLLSNENRDNQDVPSDKGMNKLVPFSDGHDIYTGLGNLDTWRQMNESMFDFSGLHNDKYFANNMEDGSTYIELNDLLSPLDFPNEIACADQSALGAILGVSDHEYMQQLYSGAIFSDVGPYAPCVNELPMHPQESHDIDNSLGVVQMVDHHIYQGSNASQGSGFASGRHESFSYPTDNMGRGWQILIGCYSRTMESDPGHRLPTAAALSYSGRGGSSMHHIKAEVTHRAGECTNEALSRLLVQQLSSFSCSWFVSILPLTNLWISLKQ